MSLTRLSVLGPLALLALCAGACGFEPGAHEVGEGTGAVPEVGGGGGGGGPSVAEAVPDAAWSAPDAGGSAPDAIMAPDAFRCDRENKCEKGYRCKSHRCEPEDDGESGGGGSD